MADPLDRLTPWQRRCLETVVGTGSSKAAAASLFIADKTVRSNLSQAYKRAGVTGIGQAAYLLGRAVERAEAAGSGE